MIIEILNKQFGDEVDLLPDRQEGTVPDVTDLKDSHLITKKVIVHEKFEKDIQALRGFIGESAFKPGLVITLSLQELLKICERERRRADSYSALVRYLSEEMGIKLIIYSQKSQNHESKKNSF